MSGKENPNSDLHNMHLEVQARLAQLDLAIGESKERLKTAANIAATATAQAEEIAEALRSGTSTVAEAQNKAAEVITLATQVLAVKTQIADDQAVIATKSDHIQQAQSHADKVRGELDRLLTAASQQATDAEGLKSRAQSAADSATGLLAEVKAAKAAADIEKTAISTLSSEAEEAAKLTKGLAAKATLTEEKILEYERQLEVLKERCEAQLATITGLLPGATSTGLSHAFDQRRQSFLKPSVRWQWVFVGSVVILVLLALSGLWNVYNTGTVLAYDELLRLWLARLPIAGALVWLALHASRESALAKRLEEDYGYKAAIAASFEGFHKQMSDIGEQAGPGTPLAQLCADTLTTIASPPGRIYDRHKLTVSPTAELADAARAAVETSGVLKAAAAK